MGHLILDCEEKTKKFINEEISCISYAKSVDFEYFASFWADLVSHKHHEMHLKVTSPWGQQNKEKTFWIYCIRKKFYASCTFFFLNFLQNFPRKLSWRSSGQEVSSKKLFFEILFRYQTDLKKVAHRKVLQEKSY